jgi:hypothetical protein
MAGAGEAPNAAEGGYARRESGAVSGINLYV